MVSGYRARLENIYCHEVYSKSLEEWTSYQICGQCAYCSCAGFEEEVDETVHVWILCQLK